jgi:membrane-associated phospholipid phosphatase
MAPITTIRAERADRAWTELGRRARQGFIRTTVATSLMTGLFFMAYFAVQRHPSHAALVMPRTALDLSIPFQPLALLAYVTLWIYLGVGPGLQRTAREFAVYGAWLGGMCVSALAIFYFWPTRVPLSMAIANGFPGFSTLHRVDETGNACPSMHVAVAIFTVVRVDELLRSMQLPATLRVVNAAWFALIVYSTLATKQHVVLDVIAGAMLGLMFAAMSLRWRPVFARQGDLGRCAHVGV